MLYTVKIMRGKTTLKQFAVIADGDTTLQKFAADALGGQADDTAVMKKFGVCDSAAFATRCSSSLAAAASASCERAAGAWSACRASREIDYFEKEWVISLFRPPLEEVGGPTHT